MKKIFTIFLLVTLVMPLRTQTLEECLKMARSSYPITERYSLIDKTEEYNVANASCAWIPQINFMAQATWQTATPTFPQELQEITGMDMSMRKDQYKIALELHQNIWDGGTASANKKIVKADAEVERQITETELNRVEERVENIYFGILLLEEKEAQIKIVQQLLLENLKRVKVLNEGGLALNSDIDQLQVELLTAGQQQEQIHASKDNYRKMLELFIGAPLRDTLLIKPEHKELQSRESARSELKLFESKILRLTAQQNLLQTEIMPKFGLFAQGYYGYPGMDMFQSMTSDDLTFNAVVGVRMSWQLGSLYTYKNKKRNIEMSKDKINIEKEIFEHNTELATTQEDGNIERLKKIIADDDRILELRRNVRKFAESQLENGMINITDLLKKISYESNAIQNKSIHEIELLQAQYRLKRILNQ